MPEAESSYYVALRYTEAAGGYEGVITWTAFPSKEAFDKWFSSENAADQEIVEEGITPERGVELALSTPVSSYATAAVEDSIDPRSGTVSREILYTRLSEIALARAFRGR